MQEVEQRMEHLPRALGRGELNKRLAIFDSPTPSAALRTGFVVLCLKLMRIFLARCPDFANTFSQ